MHLEGKLHTGYLKIRNKLNELKRDGRRKNRRRRSRSRSPGRSRRDTRDARDEARRLQHLEECYANKIIYSSKVLGSGSNMISKTH